MFSRAISRVKWLSGEKNVSKTISVLVLRVLVWLSLGVRSHLLPLTWQVNQVSVLVSSPIWDSWSDSCSYDSFCFCILFRSVVCAEM